MRALIGAPLVVVAAAVVGFGVGVGVCVDDGGTNQSARHKRTHRLDLSAFRPAGMIPALGLIRQFTDGPYQTGDVDELIK